MQYQAAVSSCRMAFKSNHKVIDYPVSFLPLLYQWDISYHGSFIVVHKVCDWFNPPHTHTTDCITPFNILKAFSRKGVFQSVPTLFLHVLWLVFSNRASPVQFWWPNKSNGNSLNYFRGLQDTCDQLKAKYPTPDTGLCIWKRMASGMNTICYIG